MTGLAITGDVYHRCVGDTWDGDVLYTACGLYLPGNTLVSDPGNRQPCAECYPEEDDGKEQ